MRVSLTNGLNASSATRRKQSSMRAPGPNQTTSESSGDGTSVSGALA